MKRIVLFGSLLFILNCFSKAQNVFDPADEIVRYNKNATPGSSQNPDTAKPGLQKWVSTPTIGVSTGSSTFDASSFKQYFINVNGNKMAFRLKFPYSYLNPDSSSKKYPVNLFLHGGGEVGCPTNGGIYNNEKPLWLGGDMYRDWVDKNQFDGFLLYPQYVVTEGCFAGWGSAPAGNYHAILAMVDSMAKYIRADIDRLVVDGLSGGGYGAWRMADNFPQRVGKIMPSAAAGSVSNRNKFVHIPIWFATGGKDVDPSPATAQNVLNKMLEVGADIRYTVYPERGHSVWYQHWREPDFVPELNKVHKANPLVFFQRNEFCREEDVNAKLGITPGFYAYEWQWNGNTIATSINGSGMVIVDQEPVITYTGNEITVRRYGTYRVRFKRSSTSAWSDWSPIPAVIKTKGETQTSPITVKGNRSRVLPALDGNTTVPLTMAPGFRNYRWYRVSDNALVDTNVIFEAPVGTYKGMYEEQYGCGTSFSPEFTVVDANGSPKPQLPTNLTAVSETQSSIKLNWTQGTGETGFEIYRSTNTGGPYQFVRLLNENVKTFTDTGLAKNTLYFYKIRSVNETGASAGSNEATAKTLIDATPPTAPSGLSYVQSSATAVRLNWKLSTDNEKVTHYDIYVNGRKLYSAYESGFVVSRLDSLIPYNFVIRAVDAAGNVSEPSNQVTFVPEGADAGEKPAIPTDVEASAPDHDRIIISWADTLSNETGFEIVRSGSVNGTYFPIATVGANRTSYTDSGLVDETKYYYRVRAIGRAGESGYSPKVNATTPKAPDTPATPPSLSGEAASNGSVLLTWTHQSGNETGYKVYKSADGTDFEELATLPANSNAYSDAAVDNFATYFYYVVPTNSAGNGTPSNTLEIRAGNNPPVITGLEDVFVKAGSSVNEPFTVTDDAGDVITISFQNKPAFVTLVSGSNGNYTLQVAPPRAQAGTYYMSVIARDNNNKSDTQAITILVGDQRTRSIYVNFGEANRTAPSPWNNWTGIKAAADVLNGLKDERGVTTSLGIQMMQGWSEINSMGHPTGDNSGIVPDVVLRSGLQDSAIQNKQIRITGLDPAKQYNLVFVGSRNEGIMAEAEYAAGDQLSRLNARYNTRQSGNLNSLRPEADGSITVTINRAAGTPAIFLNALIVEEYETSIYLLEPGNVYAEPLNRQQISLMWSDRSYYENLSDGFEITRSTDSLFSNNVQVTRIPGNSNQYTSSGLAPDTRYWFRIRSMGNGIFSEYSRKVSAKTPGTIVYVNFNVSVADAPSPWNNLTQPPLSNFTVPDLKDQSGRTTTMALTLEQEFNGEFTSGINTGNNSGVAPDNVLRANYWLDNKQVSKFRLSGLSHDKQYRIGFIGSSGPDNWFRNNYTAAYTVKNKTVVLNSWENRSKIVFIDDVSPESDGTLMLDFSTTEEGGYGFNAGLVIQEYSYTAPAQEPDTTQQPPVDTIPGGENPPPIDTIPGGENPPPVDTIPGGENPPPVDTIPGGENPPPVDTIPGGENPPPVDTIPGGENPPPVDTIPGGGNPPPVDSIPTPVDSIPEIEVVEVKAYPNPFTNTLQVLFNNQEASDRVTIEIHDSHGRLTYRRDYGTRQAGNNILLINGFTANMRNGLYYVSLKLNNKHVRTLKLIKSGY